MTGAALGGGGDLAGVLIVVFLCLICMPLPGMLNRRRKALGKMFETCDVRMTPILFEFLPDTVESKRSHSSKQEEEAFVAQTRAVLLRLLPEVRQEHASLFGSRPRALWRRFLKRAPSNVTDTELSILLIKALEILGDDQDLEIVERIADGRSARSWPLKQAACAYVDATRDRLKQEQAHASLLRPADSGDLTGQTLLRPHSNRAVSSPEQLLRASHASEGKASDNIFFSNSPWKSPDQHAPADDMKASP